MSFSNIPPVNPLKAPVLPVAPIAAPAEFAARSVGTIAGFLGGIAAPVLTLALVGLGMKTIITGKPPKILG